ncbi:MAG TPA: NADP-dependent oxidoreductase [Candidatus Binatia bacterium]|jgi:NADPH:quinone reductase-like Zn-dependent oxidoreductase|nr:NADP-dependent oxidoreductase [Candidatus Binatia bacterium]
MKAVRVHRFGPPEVISLDDLPKPEPGRGEVVVRVKAAGIGPWDALIRSGKSVLPQPLPLILGSDLSGEVDSVGAGVNELQVGDEVFGVTNERFTGAYTEYAVAKAAMLAPKPKRLNHTHAASVPVVAVTAWQMVFDLAQLSSGQAVLVHGGAGNVGGYAVQLAKRAGAMVIATASVENDSYVRRLGADGVIDYRARRFEERVKGIDAVLDTVGGETLDRSYGVLKRGGIIVSSAVQPSRETAEQHGVRAVFFLVQVTTERLKTIGEMIDGGTLQSEVGEVLWLDEARRGHEMLEGAPHRRGKIVIKVAD